jgi:predicted DNA-binding protein (UPF0251 family)
MKGLPVMILSIDGLEALRLADAEGLDHQDAAGRMGISRPTFTRLVAEARAVVAKALVNGWALGIKGGSFEITNTSPPSHTSCQSHQELRDDARHDDERQADSDTPPREKGDHD